MFNGQALQDKFVINILQEKQNGFFIELGSNDPYEINNTYILEKTYNWKGIMVEIDNKYLESYKNQRHNSIHIIQDATTIDYNQLFINNNVPKHIDYLQIDLEPGNGSTLITLEKMDKEVLDNYKFAVITFEHDIYRKDILFEITRNKSREIFENRGYVRVFSDISNLNNPYEDWYVHPDLVDMNYVEKLIKINMNNYNNNMIEYSNIIY
jgi:hypothetical protein